MNKKLPSVFANKIVKNINNNERVYYSKSEENNKIEDEKEVKNDKYRLGSNLNINQKINKIFSSARYVYKADVHILLKSGEVDERIIGRNSTNLITINNKLIPISDIVDIYFKEK